MTRNLCEWRRETRAGDRRRSAPPFRLLPSRRSPLPFRPAGACLPPSRGSVSFGCQPRGSASLPAAPRGSRRPPGRREKAQRRQASRQPEGRERRDAGSQGGEEMLAGVRKGGRECREPLRFVRLSALCLPLSEGKSGAEAERALEAARAKTYGALQFHLKSLEQGIFGCVGIR